MRAHSFPLFLTAALALAACNPYEFNKPVGSEIDEGGFGNATMNNTLLMTGQIDATSALGNRFATEAPSTITFAFNSSQLTEAARVTLRQPATGSGNSPKCVSASTAIPILSALTPITNPWGYAARRLLSPISAALASAPRGLRRWCPMARPSPSSRPPAPKNATAAPLPKCPAL